jgi:hypothetical protein
MTVAIPTEFADWLLEYFYSQPMKQSENIVYTLRALIAEAKANEAQAPVQDGE